MGGLKAHSISETSVINNIQHLTKGHRFHPEPMPLCFCPYRWYVYRKLIGLPMSRSALVLTLQMVRLS